MANIYTFNPNTRRVVKVGSKAFSNTENTYLSENTRILRSNKKHREIRPFEGIGYKEISYEKLEKHLEYYVDPELVRNLPDRLSEIDFNKHIKKYVEFSSNIKHSDNKCMFAICIFRLMLSHLHLYKLDKYKRVFTVAYNKLSLFETFTDSPNALTNKKIQIMASTFKHYIFNT